MTDDPNPPAPSAPSEPSRLPLSLAPGTTVGLLLVGSPVIVDGCSGVVIDTNGGGEPFVVGSYRRSAFPRSRSKIERGVDLALDLTNPTGAIHGLWWLLRRFGLSSSGAHDRLRREHSAIEPVVTYTVLGEAGSVVFTSYPPMDGQSIHVPALVDAESCSEALVMAIATAESLPRRSRRSLISLAFLLTAASSIP